jgi:hypothetical protein
MSAVTLMVDFCLKVEMYNALSDVRFDKSSDIHHLLVCLPVRKKKALVLTSTRHVLFMLSTKYIGIYRRSINVILMAHQLHCIDKS